MEISSEIRKSLRTLAKLAWEYIGLAAIMGTWGYRRPMPGEIQETAERMDELVRPRATSRCVRLEMSCCASEIDVPCCT
jgi:hypothetical protein